MFNLAKFHLSLQVSIEVIHVNWGGLSVEFSVVTPDCYSALWNFISLCSLWNFISLCSFSSMNENFVFVFFNKTLKLAYIITTEY